MFSPRNETYRILFLQSPEMQREIMEARRAAMRNTTAGHVARRVTTQRQDNLTRKNVRNAPPLVGKDQTGTLRWSTAFVSDIFGYLPLFALRGSGFMDSDRLLK